MQYNYDFEIASLLVMVIILVHFAFVRQFPSEKKQILKLLMLSCVLECVINLTSCVCLANAALVPQIVNEVLAFAFFVFEGTSSYLIFRYFMACGERRVRHKTAVWLVGTLPFLVFEVLVITTPVTHFFYYFQEGAYYQGFGAGFGYAYILYYFMLNIIFVVLRRKVMGLKVKLIVSVYTLAAVLLIVIQYFHKTLVFNSTGNAVMLFMTYLAIQNPQELLDMATGSGNNKALQQQLRNYMERGKKLSLLTIGIQKMDNLRAMIGMDNTSALMAEISRFLYEIGGKYNVFHEEGGIFTVLVEDEQQREWVQNAVRERFEKEWAAETNQVVLNMGLVTLTYPRDFSAIAEYFGIRSFLLGEAETMGSHAVIEADEASIERYYRQTKVEVAVNRAIRENTFEVYYQPIYSMKEKRIAKLEALLRLRDEEIGFIPPDEFIPLAERDGSIIQIGEIVLEECCKFLAKHVLANNSLGVENIHINVSMAQCLRHSLTETIAPTLEKYHIPPAMITLEITERTAIHTPERMLRHMEELGKMGVSFAMDDYGSGNSNCSYLIRFPFREIKIDKEIVWDSFENEAAKLVLENEIATIKELGNPIVVEGIESREQSEHMEELGVDYIQGYYYGKPMPELEVLRYIRSFNGAEEDYGKN